MDHRAVFNNAAQDWNEFLHLDPSPLPIALFPPPLFETETTEEEQFQRGSQVPSNFVGDEECILRSPFVPPVAPSPKGWCQLDDIVSAYKQAANLCDHRFNIAVSTSAHTSKKLNSILTIDYATLYCSCPKQVPGQSGPKPHAKSFCPWLVKLKLDKDSMTWNVVSYVAEHLCTSLPDFSITATGMRMLRNASELTSEEVAFVHDQIDNVGTYPRLIQWNFSKKFVNRKPTSDVIISMRQAHHAKQYGLQSENVAALQKKLDQYVTDGGVGKVDWDEQLQISRVVIMRPDMVPFLKKYGRVLICDATHGITMSKFRLFTVVVVNSLYHSTMVAYAFIRTEAAVHLEWIFEALHLDPSIKPVFVSDDNPAARVLCNRFQFHHILCQWHYAKNWSKACQKAKLSRVEMHSFGEHLVNLMTTVNFKDDNDFNRQLHYFCQALMERSSDMENWSAKFCDDIKLVAEWWRRSLYTAGNRCAKHTWYTRCACPGINRCAKHTWYTRCASWYTSTPGIPGRISGIPECSQLVYQFR